MWFLPSGVIHLMPYSTDVVVNYFAQSVGDAQRFMFGEPMPGCERKIFTELVLFASIEDLSWYVYRCHPVERSL
jgi:hypothetical protein